MNFSEKGIIIDIRYAKTTKAGEVQHIIIPQGKHYTQTQKIWMTVKSNKKLLC